MRTPQRAMVLIVAMVVASCGSSSTPKPTATRPYPTPAAVGATASPIAGTPTSPGVSGGPGPSASIGPPVDVVATHVAVVRQAPHPPALDAVAFADSAHGWAGGTGVILGTSDGGSSWRTEWTGSGTVLSLSAVDARHAWALVGAPGGAMGYPGIGRQLLRTTDGTHWSPVGPGTPLHVIDFTSAADGWAIASASSDASLPGELLETADGGTSWQRGPLTPLVQSACFSGMALGWAANGSAVYRTTDAGASWTKVATGPNDRNNPHWYATLHCSGDTAWVLFIGGGAMNQQAYLGERTLDAGAHWQTLLSDPFFPRSPNGTTSIDAYSGPFAVASSRDAGFLGSCPACGAGSWSFTRTANGGPTFTHAPLVGTDGAVLDDVAFADPLHGWIAGSIPDGGGFLLASGDGGATWHPAYPSVAPSPAIGVSFVSPTVGFGIGVLGDGRVVLRTDDGGSTWQQVGRLPADPEEFSQDHVLWFLDAYHGWGTTQSGLLTTSDGGRTWSPVPGALPEHPGPSDAGVAFVDVQHGCVGDVESAMATSDGGRTWVAATAPAGVLACAAGLVDPRWVRLGQPPGSADQFVLDAVLPGGVAVGHGYIDGPPGVVVTHDGGSTWTAELWPSGPNGVGYQGLLPVSYVSPSEGWFLGLVGQLYRTCDGGASWTQIGPG